MSDERYNDLGRFIRQRGVSWLLASPAGRELIDQFLTEAERRGLNREQRQQLIES